MKDDLARKMDNLSIGAIRALVLDQTGKANSGHPGMPLDVAPAYQAQCLLSMGTYNQRSM